MYGFDDQITFMHAFPSNQRRACMIFKPQRDFSCSGRCAASMTNTALVVALVLAVCILLTVGMVFKSRKKAARVSGRDTDRVRRDARTASKQQERANTTTREQHPSYATSNDPVDRF